MRVEYYRYVPIFKEDSHLTGLLEYESVPASEDDLTILSTAVEIDQTDKWSTDKYKVAGKLIAEFLKNQYGHCRLVTVPKKVCGVKNQVLFIHILTTKKNLLSTLKDMATKLLKTNNKKRPTTTNFWNYLCAYT
jgi:hypothetical protein